MWICLLSNYIILPPRVYPCLFINIFSIIVIHPIIKQPASYGGPCNRVPFHIDDLRRAQRQSKLFGISIAEDVTNFFFGLCLDVLRNIGLREKEGGADGGCVIGVAGDGDDVRDDVQWQNQVAERAEDAGFDLRRTGR